MNQQQGIRSGKCCCDCGTRIVIDQQLLQQRQMWKQKYLCLQKGMVKDIGQMKQSIYTQCSTLMQQQFQTKQKQHSKQLNKKYTQIQQLTSKIISLETTLKVMNRQKQLQNVKFVQLEDQIKEKDRLINMLKTQTMKSQHDWQNKFEDDMMNFRRKLLSQNKDMIQEIQTENQHLKHKLKDFQKKYQILIPQVQRLKSSLAQKCSTFDSLQQKYQRLKRDQIKQIGNITIQKDQIQKTHSTCRAQILKLNDKIGQLQIQIRNQKKAKNEVKVQPIYIQRPVHVQKIVQRIIPVQKVIKQYVQPQLYRDQALQHQYSKLKNENDRILKDNNILQRKYQQTVKDYQKVIQQYQSNITKYKQQRQSLGLKIKQLNKQLDIIYNVKKIDNLQNQLHINNKNNNQPDNIKVYIKNDGISQYYSTGTTIPRIMTVNSPRTLQRSTSRQNNSRNKPLSNSQSTKKIVGWK